MAERISVDTMMSQIPRLMRTAGRVYMAGTRSLLENFGPEGEKSVRQWIRRFATWRGHELRKAHMALGLSINMESLMRHWDTASTFDLRDEWDKLGSWSPYDVRVTIKEGGCKISEPWAEADFWLWGHVFCDELHQNITQAYHPDALVVIPTTLTKRDPECNFHWSMPPNARKEVKPIDLYPGQDVLKDWQSNTEWEAAASVLRRTTRVMAAMIHYLFEILEEFHPKEAKVEFGRIMVLLAADRASALKKEREANHWRARPEDFFFNFDLPYSTILETEKKISPDEIEIKVKYCPLAETWEWLGSLSNMNSYCERACLGIASIYDASLNVEISGCKPRGDETCHIKIRKTR